MKETKCILREAKAAVSSLAVLKSEEKNKALLAMADALIADTSSILCENKKDMDAAKDTISSVMLDRLKLDESRIRAMADGMAAFFLMKRAQTDFIFKKSLYQWVLSLLFTKAAQMLHRMLLL